MRNCLHRASNEVLVTLVERLSNIRDEYLPPSHFIFVLDEAQQAARSYPYCFMSFNSDGVFLSIIREIVEVFTKSPIKLVVSGTGPSLAEIEDTMASGVSKPAGAASHQLGMFDTWSKLKPFLERCIPVFILESPSGYRLQQRIRKYLQGR
jgi:hypothetical protein